MPEHADQRSRKQKIEAEVNFSDMRESRGSSSRLKIPAINERPYVSPYPVLSEGRPPKQTSPLKNTLKVESGSSSTSSSSTPSSFLTDRDGYFEVSTPSKIELRDYGSPDSDSRMAMVGRDFTGSPKGFGGVLTAVSSLNNLPIKPTIRNAELFQLCELFVRDNL